MFDQTHCQICYQGSSCRCFGGPKKKGEFKSVLAMIGIAVLMVVTFLHTVTWNTHALSVVVIKVKAITGIADSDDYKKMASICFDRKKYSCAEDSLISALKLNDKDTDSWGHLGELQHRLGKFELAAKALETYQAQGGKDIDSIYTLAKSYMELKQSEKALDTLTALLRTKPDTLQVTVTRSYVEALMQANKWKQAKKVIEKTRGTSASYNMFMNGEYRLVMSKVGQRNLASH